MKTFTGTPRSSRSYAFAASLLAAALLTLTAGTTSRAAEQAKAPTPPPAFNNACRTCHSIRQGDNRIGPSLHGIFGAKSGNRPGFASSAALKNAAVTWDAQSLDRFIENPDAVAPNNAMKPYGGLPDAAARKQIVEYLKSAK